MVLTCLATGTVSLGQPASKPFKVCPEIVTAKDTPCRVLGTTTAIVSRMEIPDTAKEDRERVKQAIKALRELADTMEKSLETPSR